MRAPRARRRHGRRMRHAHGCVSPFRLWPGRQNCDVMFLLVGDRSPHSGSLHAGCATAPQRKIPCHCIAACHTIMLWCCRPRTWSPQDDGPTLRDALPSFHTTCVLSQKASNALAATRRRSGQRRPTRTGDFRTGARNALAITTAGAILNGPVGKPRERGHRSRRRERKARWSNGPLR